MNATMTYCYDHPASRATFCFVDQGGEEETLPESSQAFEVNAARTSGLVVNLVVSRQTGFFECKHPVVDYSNNPRIRTWVLRTC